MTAAADPAYKPSIDGEGAAGEEKNSLCGLPDAIDGSTMTAHVARIVQGS